MSRARAWLQLVRVPNLFTAAADVLAGYLFAGGEREGVNSLALLIFASVCFYAGGVTLNDVFDATRDALERPGRPIPSGAISRRAAGVFGAVLLAAGVGLCWFAGADALRIGAGLAGCIVFYDIVLKRTPLAPGAMGMCRALNLWLGMSVVAGWASGAAAYAAGMMWLYVTSVTFFARREAGVNSRMRLGVGLGGVLAAVCGLAALQGGVGVSRLVAIGATAGVVGAVGIRAVVSCAARDVQKAVGVFVLSLVLFDACLVVATRGAMEAGMVVVWLIPAVVLSKLFRVT